MNESVYSKNGRFNVTLNRLGNLFIYDNWAVHDTGELEEEPLQDHKYSIEANEMFDIVWNSADYGRSFRQPIQIKGDRKCVVMHDCEAAIYETLGDYSWATGTKGEAKEGIKLVMEDDGGLVLYGDSKAVWTSKDPIPKHTLQSGLVFAERLKAEEE